MFNKDFIFGVSTASYQIEGSRTADNGAECIWDTFAKVPGKVFEEHDGAVACDHYNRYKDDVKLIANLGVDYYRFSISWPRIFPKKGEFNLEGMKFYVNLVNELKAKGIKSAITLYHWDLPQWAQELGGWCNREIITWFMEYVDKCFEYLGSEVDCWITHNEPFCAGFLGHIIGVHAPGIKSYEKGLQAVHHMLLTHGLTVQEYRLRKLRGQIGIVLNLEQGIAKTNSFEDQIALNAHSGFMGRWFLEPLFNRTYPMDMVNLFSKFVADFSFVKEKDFDVISVECDFIGLNFYTGKIVEYDATSPLLNASAHTDMELTDMGWTIWPESLKFSIDLIRKYTDLPIIITENGAATADSVSEDGQVHDEVRVKYIKNHLKVVEEINENGGNITGYFVWSLMDNYEWSFGYDKRFGITYVDYETQERIPKDSYKFFRDFIKNNREMQKGLRVCKISE